VVSLLFILVDESIQTSRSDVGLTVSPLGSELPNLQILDLFPIFVGEKKHDTAQREYQIQIQLPEKSPTCSPQSLFI
jgi:hypothetical protein